MSSTLPIPHEQLIPLIDAAIPMLLEGSMKFPGALLSLTQRQWQHIGSDKHSILFGEVRRHQKFLSKLDEERAALALSSHPDWRQRAALKRFIHDYFVGDRKDPDVRHTRMYQGTTADFDRNYGAWKKACGDVEAMYDHLMTRVPRHVTLYGVRRDLRRLLSRPEEVSQASDVLKLIELTRRGSRRSSSDLCMRHFARQKLVFAQLNWEFRRYQFSPEVLEDETAALQKIVIRNLFGGREGERVHIVATLDPKDAYRCRRWHVVEDPAFLPEPTETCFVLPVMRFYVRIRGGEKLVPIFFFLRYKQHPLLKAINKHIRFLQLMGYGDGIAMMFVVEPEHLDDVVGEVRRVLVRCPGQVCDQGSSIGHRNGKPLDGNNRYTSARYEAMKYVSLQYDRPVEVQFAPTISWIDTKCSHDRVNHDWYKLMQIAGEIMHILFPIHLIGVPWPCQFDKDTGLPTYSRELWDEMIEHVLKKPTAF